MTDETPYPEQTTDATGKEQIDDSEDPEQTDAEARKQTNIQEHESSREYKYPSRRTFLQATAAAGAVTGLGSTSIAQETTTTQQGGQGFFEQGTRVGTQMVANGQLTAPTDFAVASGENDRHFVSDQTGQVWEITDDGLASEPFIDVQERMVELGRFYGLYASDQQNYDERGLLGIDFHPNFQENRKFYLHYSAPPTDLLRNINWDHVEVIAEFRAGEDLNSASLDSERRLMELPSPQYNHDAGPMAFGPDGYLYVPMGDGGGANDNYYGHVPDWYDRNTGGNGQDVVTNLLGTVLRIDVDSQDQEKEYGIPNDNPFAGDTAGLDEIYAYGFRNPFGIGFDSQGNMFVADAGQNLWEEANVVEKGGNYGWNVKEGTHCFSTEQPSDPSAITNCPSSTPDQAPYNGDPLIDPIVEFPHEYQGDFVGITIVGGHRYEQSTISGLQGKYIYGAWTEDPAREQPAGRILAATPPEGFDQGGGATTTKTTGTGNTTTGNQTKAGTTIASGDQTETAEGNNATEETTPPGQKAPVGNETAGNQTEGNQTAGEQQVPPPGPEVVPRDDLWDMEELVIEGEFNWFVRMFGRGSDGEIYVLVNKRGVPEGDTGAVLKLVPPEEGNTTEGTTTQTETTMNGTTTQG
ncbi:hypothetical protein DMJ13_23400 [halophilic archaeon]|nr:hypothetical protein DMJ13_23400 [halophilic archaeon]